ncbi:MAG: DUF5606 domain-containing protein [Flavobacteriales bacterium]|nr:DUF5606 domain-containing protein [Flavobacteriales bacterium]
MDFSKIISVSGRPGLFRVIAQGRQAVIAESLIDGKRVPVHSSMQVSSLDEISMFTTGEDVPLKEVLSKLYEQDKDKEALDPKGEEGTLWAKLGEVLPDHDKERIYASDLRKFFSWYKLLLSSGTFESLLKEAEGEKKEQEKAKKGAKKAPAKGAKAAKKAASADKKPAAPKGGSGKAKSTTVRKGSQRGG